ncbi:MAG: glycosyltransferase family 2 protein [Acidimicrobiales bacterium]
MASVSPANLHKVSVVIPVYNRRDYLLRAVQSACSQIPAPDEVIVVDDGSTDGSGDVVARLHPLVSVIRLPHLGRSRARNEGVRSSSGDLVAFLDSDDEWIEGHLGRQIETLRGSPTAGLVAGHVQVVDSEGRELLAGTMKCRKVMRRFERDGCSIEAWIRHPAIFSSTVMVRRTVLDDVGLFDETLPANEDWDLWLRVICSWPVSVAPAPPLVRYRIHAGNSASLEMSRGMARLVSNHLSGNQHLSPKARALLAVRGARAYRTLFDERGARSALGDAFRADPVVALHAGGVRLLAGSMLRTCGLGRRGG